MNGENGLSNEALTIKLAHIEDMVRGIQESLPEMATREQVAKLVGREEFSRLSWEFDRHRTDTARELGSLRGELDKRSWRALLKDWTTILAAVSSTVALYAVFFADKGK